tara:strand:- start:1381 stop:1845 length:465 start_codon:yes stop_codon:yes gene_type:complete
MSEYINIYNNLIKLATNKQLYKGFISQDTFSDRLILFLIHFAFFLKVYKNDKNTKILQNIYDFVFRQLELSLREIGYGDQSINKKMKDYINMFHSIVSEIHFWDQYDLPQKKIKILLFLENIKENDYLIKYFDHFKEDLQKKNLNFFLKSVNKQ